MTPAQVSAIPEELKALPQWLIWRSEPRGGRNTKVPYDPRSGKRASTTKPATWTTFEQATEMLTASDYSGVGFVFAKDDPFTGIDLDKCIGEDGAVEPWAARIIEHLDSYTEISPSGRGLHVFVRGALPEGGRRKGPIEMYDQGRYFTVTGRRFVCPD